MPISEPHQNLSPPGELMLILQQLAALDVPGLLLINPADPQAYWLSPQALRLLGLPLSQMTHLPSGELRASLSAPPTEAPSLTTSTGTGFPDRSDFEHLDPESQLVNATHIPHDCHLPLRRFLIDELLALLNTASSERFSIFHAHLLSPKSPKNSHHHTHVDQDLDPVVCADPSCMDPGCSPATPTTPPWTSTSQTSLFEPIYLQLVQTPETPSSPSTSAFCSPDTPPSEPALYLQLLPSTPSNTPLEAESATAHSDMVHTVLPVYSTKPTHWHLLRLSPYVHQSDNLTTRMHLYAGNQTLKLALTSAKFGLWTFNTHTQKLTWDAQMYEIYGTSPSDFDGSPEQWRAFIHPDDQELVDAQFVKLLSHQQVEDFNFRITNSHNGRILTLSANGVGYVDPWGHTILIGLNKDTSAQVQRTEQLHIYEKTLGALSEAVVITTNQHTEPDGDSRIVYVNRAFERMTGYQGTQITGINPRFLQGPLSFRSILDPVAERLKDNLTTQAHLINYRKNGDIFWVNMNISLIGDGNSYTHCCAIEHDITDQKAQELLQQIYSRVLQLANGSPPPPGALHAVDSTGRTPFDPLAHSSSSLSSAAPALSALDPLTSSMAGSGSTLQNPMDLLAQLCHEACVAFNSTQCFLATNMPHFESTLWCPSKFSLLPTPHTDTMVHGNTHAATRTPFSVYRLTQNIPQVASLLFAQLLSSGANASLVNPTQMQHMLYEDLRGSTHVDLHGQPASQPNSTLDGWGATDASATTTNRAATTHTVPLGINATNATNGPFTPSDPSVAPLMQQLADDWIEGIFEWFSKEHQESAPLMVFPQLASYVQRSGRFSHDPTLDPHYIVLPINLTSSVRALALFPVFPHKQNSGQHHPNAIGALMELMYQSHLRQNMPDSDPLRAPSSNSSTSIASSSFPLPKGFAFLLQLISSSVRDLFLQNQTQERLSQLATARQVQLEQANYQLSHALEALQRHDLQQNQLTQDTALHQSLYGLSHQMMGPLGNTLLLLGTSRNTIESLRTTLTSPERTLRRDVLSQIETVLELHTQMLAATQKASGTIAQMSSAIWQTGAIAWKWPTQSHVPSSCDWNALLGRLLCPPSTAESPSNTLASWDSWFALCAYEHITGLLTPLPQNFGSDPSLLALSAASTSPTQALCQWSGDFHAQHPLFHLFSMYHLAIEARLLAEQIDALHKALAERSCPFSPPHTTRPLIHLGIGPIAQYLHTPIASHLSPFDRSRLAQQQALFFDFYAPAPETCSSMVAHIFSPYVLDGDSSQLVRPNLALWAIKKFCDTHLVHIHHQLLHVPMSGGSSPYHRFSFVLPLIEANSQHSSHPVDVH